MMLWEDLVDSCDSVETYLEILDSFYIDNKFNKGRKLVLIEFTRAVSHSNPAISGDINRILQKFLDKHYPDSCVKL